MYGHIGVILKSLVVSCFGQEVWAQVRRKAKMKQDLETCTNYPDDLIERLIDAAAVCTGFPRGQFMELLGEHYIRHLKDSEHGHMLEHLGHNILEFLQNIDFVHAKMLDKFPEMSAPFFRCSETSSADRIELHYYSTRQGYPHMVIGMVRAAASILYKRDVRVAIVSRENSDETPNRGHVVLDIAAARPKDDDQGEVHVAPTFVAQTRKHGERQISKEDVEAVTRRLAEFHEDAEHAPLAAIRRGKAKWRAVARVTAMSRAFVPVCPEVNPVNSRMFIDLFPYHVICDSVLRIHMCGVQIQRLMPSIRNPDSYLPDFFHLVYPREETLKFESLCDFISSPVVMAPRKRKLADIGCKSLHLKGQMYLVRDNSCILYLATPLVKSWSDLQESTLTLADLASHDPTRDLLFQDTSQTSTRVIIEQREPADKRAHRRDVTTALLPATYATIVQNGNRPLPAYHEEVTAMFCDVVEFVKMATICRPADVIRVLNDLHNAFDVITKVHGVYRVEIIGDAYFVVSGVPDHCSTHGERIANTALGMMAAVRKVSSPLGAKQLMIRIGVHTGSLMSGVLGTSVPRLMVFGETSVIAARMESHGLPGKIQITQGTFRVLKGKGFTFEQRGQIPVRGLGKIMAHFLLSNQNTTEETLMGKRTTSNHEEAVIENEKQDVSMFENKVHPTNETLEAESGRRKDYDEGFVPFHYPV